MSLVTREELDAVRNHISNIPPIGSMYAPVLVEHCRALLDEVEKLKAREESLVQQSVAQMGMIGRLQEEVERMAVECDAAFKRGAEAMRTAAIAAAHKRSALPVENDMDVAWCRAAACIEEEVRTLIVTEDKP